MPTMTKTWLPTSISEAHIDDNRFSILLYGQDKVGKSKFCSSIPNHLIIACRMGNIDHIDSKRVYIGGEEDMENPKGLENFIEILNQVQSTPDCCDTLIIDDADRLYEHCVRHYAVNRFKIKEHELPSRIVWYTVRNKMTQIMGLLKSLPCGLVFTFNEELESIDDISTEITRRNITASPQYKTILRGQFLMRMYMDIGNSGDSRLTIEGSRGLAAGNGYDKNFLYEGKKLKRFSIGNDGNHGWTMFKMAFNNQLKGEVI